MSKEYFVKFRPFDKNEKLHVLSLFRLRRKDEILFDVVAKDGNIRLCLKNYST